MNDNNKDNADAARVSEYKAICRERDDAREEVRRLRSLIDTFCDRAAQTLAPLRKGEGFIKYAEDAVDPSRAIGHTLHPNGGGPCE